MKQWLFHTMVFIGGFVLPSTGWAQSTMHTGGFTSQPIGHYEFCAIYRKDCKQIDYADPLVFNKSVAIIAATNTVVNTAITPASDQELYGREEVWTFPDKAGDCEDYVLLKRQLLLNKGIPASDLLITVVKKPNDKGHAVLTIRTDEGDFILDNLTNKIKRWDATPYRYLKRQAANDAGRWVKILPPDEELKTASTNK